MRAKCRHNLNWYTQSSLLQKPNTKGLTDQNQIKKQWPLSKNGWFYLGQPLGEKTVNKHKQHPGSLWSITHVWKWGIFLNNSKMTAMVNSFYHPHLCLKCLNKCDVKTSRTPSIMGPSPFVQNIPLNPLIPSSSYFLLMLQSACVLVQHIDSSSGLPYSSIPYGNKKWTSL